MIKREVKRKMELKEKKKLVAERIKNFDYSLFGEYKLTIKTYASILRRAILLSDDEQFQLFIEKLKEYEQTIYDIIDGKPVNLELDEKEREYFNQAVEILKFIEKERRENLKLFIKRVLDVFRE